MMGKIKNALILLCCITLTLMSCGTNDDNNRIFISETVTYDLYDVDNSTVMGRVTMGNNDSTTVVLTIILSEGTGSSHPVGIYTETANENGTQVLTLNPINSSGVSSTIFTQLDNGTEITYDQMVEFDGNIKVQMSSADNTIVAVGDIGQNKLTGTSTTYPLNEANTSGVDGIVIFAERMNGEALVALQLDGTTAGTSSPAMLNNGALGMGGTVAANLNNVDGTFGESRTSLLNLNGGATVLYNDLTTFDGNITVQASSTDTTIICEGNIGSN